MTLSYYLKYTYTWLMYKLHKLCIKDFNIYFNIFFTKAGVSSL